MAKTPLLTWNSSALAAVLDRPERTLYAWKQKGILKPTRKDGLYGVPEAVALKTYGELRDRKAHMDISRKAIRLLHELLTKQIGKVVTQPDNYAMLVLLRYEYRKKYGIPETVQLATTEEQVGQILEQVQWKEVEEGFLPDEPTEEFVADSMFISPDTEVEDLIFTTWWRHEAIDPQGTARAWYDQPDWIKNLIERRRLAVREQIESKEGLRRLAVGA